MDINAAFPSRFLRASDLTTGPVIATIDRVEIESVGGGQGHAKEDKPVVYFRGKKKGLVLNKVNANAIAKIAGTTEMDDWPGVQVELYTTDVEFGGDTIEAIRVRAPRAAVRAARPPQDKPAQALPEDRTPDDDDVPF